MQRPKDGGEDTETLGPAIVCSNNNLDIMGFVYIELVDDDIWVIMGEYF